MMKPFGRTESFFPSFCNKLRAERAKLPYSINILDELHGNENFHSRFLVRVLNFKFGDEYPILADFLSNLKEPFSNLVIDSPWLSAESDRIDARIRLQNSSVIIENKVQGAVEQPNQVDRYISNEIAAGYEPANIYVLYLTRTGGTASEQSLSVANRKMLGNRYRDISFRSDLLPWLRSLSKGLLSKLDPLVSRQVDSALTQYTDHLHGLFFEREGDEIMKNEIFRFLETELNISKQQAASQKVQIISRTKEFASDLQAYLQELEDTEIFGALSLLQERIKAIKLTGIASIQYSDNFGEKYSQIFVRPQGWQDRYAIGFSFDERFARLFYGIRDFEGVATEEFQKKLSDLFLPALNDPNPTWPLGIWLHSDRLDSEFLAQIEDGRFLTQFQEIIENIAAKGKHLVELQAR